MIRNKSVSSDPARAKKPGICVACAARKKLKNRHFLHSTGSQPKRCALLQCVITRSRIELIDLSSPPSSESEDDEDDEDKEDEDDELTLERAELDPLPLPPPVPPLPPPPKCCIDGGVTNCASCSKILMLVSPRDAAIRRSCS